MHAPLGATRVLLLVAVFGFLPCAKLEKNLGKKILVGCFFECENLHARGPPLSLVPRDTPVDEILNLRIVNNVTLHKRTYKDADGNISAVRYVVKANGLTYKLLTEIEKLESNWKDRVILRDEEAVRKDTGEVFRNLYAYVPTYVEEEVVV